MSAEASLTPPIADAPPARPFTPFAPAPRARPAGTLAQLWLLARNPIETWSRAHYEKPILSGPSLLGHVTVVNDPAAIRRVLIDNAANYEKDALQLRVLRAGARPGAGDGLLVASGEAWKRARRTLAPLFTPRRVAAFAPLMEMKAQARVDAWLRRRAGSIVEIDREMGRVAYEILSATLFSDALVEERAGFEREMGRLLDSIGRIDPLDVLNAPQWLPRLHQREAQESRAWFEGAVERLVAARRAQMEADPARTPDDLLTALLRASDPDTGVGLTPQVVAANLFTFIAAGHETTAHALAWTFHLLARAPYWQERARAEARNAPDDPSQWPDALPCVRAVLEESMRLFPPVPHMSRAAVEADELAGVAIPAGSTIVVAPWLLHRHKTLWERPSAFMPERFLPGARERIDRFAYLPFGAGPRVCIGATFAMQEAMIVLVAVLRSVRFAPAQRHEPRPLLRITLRPDDRVPLIVTPV
jgi:cytochrome P450